ncbi:hypothetical protein QGM_0062 [Clostridioides difficile CD211]|nr:hypothetical protein QGM_3839 [Clostridioides difficile CD211]EQF84169.1 hypothetical protein QGM_0062 [Clostridioides difficile CD211]
MALVHLLLNKLILLLHLCCSCYHVLNVVSMPGQSTCA